MKLLRAWLGALPGYLWSGWGAIASLLLGMALWEALAAWYGPLVRPTPLETAQMLLHLQAWIDEIFFRFEPLAVKITAGLHGGVGLTSQGEMVVEAISAPQQQ